MTDWKHEWEAALKGTECPITRRPFFMLVEHPTRGCVPTYGGPFDSYTVPEVDRDGELLCDHYDHDRGGWIAGRESIGMLVVERDDYERLLAGASVLTDDQVPPKPRIEVRHDDPSNCPVCGHRHAGPEYAGICIGCPCPMRTKVPQ